jgi:hypothetical protein
MGNDSFENKLEQEMMGLRIKPSQAVWQQVENRIQKERKRRIILWWIFSSCILIAGTGVWISEERSTRDEQKTTQNNSESKIAVNSSNKKSSISEESSIPYSSNQPSKETQHHLYNRSSKILPKGKAQEKIYQEEFNTEPSPTPNSLQNMVTDHLSRSLLPSNIDIIKKLNEKIKDTIIVVICNNPPTSPSLEKEMKKPERQLNFNGFLSFHGTGDLSGTNLEFGIERKWGKRYGFYNNLGVTIHSGQEGGFGLSSYPLLVNSTYKSLQTVTAGIQTMPTFYRYSKRGDLKIGAGLVARYQMTSSGMYAARGMGPGTNQYSYNIYEIDPNTFSLGYRISADLLLFETKKNKLGFQLYFQNDTRGDALTGLGLSFQTKYKK